MTLGSGFTYFFWQDEWNGREELFRKIITENLGEELKEKAKKLQKKVRRRILAAIKISFIKWRCTFHWVTILR